MSTTCVRRLGFNFMETAVENTFSQLIFFLTFNYNCFKALLLLIVLYMTGRTLFLKNQFIIWVFSIIPEKYLEQTQLEFLWLWWWRIFFVVWLTDERRLALFQLGSLSEILTISNLRHAASRVWRCAEPEFRFSWMKLCSSDNHYTWSKVNTGNNRTMCDIGSKLTKMPARRHWRRSGIFIFYCDLLLSLLTLNK